MALVKKLPRNAKPEVVPWQRVVFCDQTDVLSGPIAEKHFYSPDQLKEQATKGWQNVDEVITLAKNAKVTNKATGKQAQTPGKYIEVYEVHGMFPRYWLYDTDSEGNLVGEYYDEKSDDMEYIRQLHVITFYQDTAGNKKGITLYKGKENKLPYKLILRDRIYGRGLGLGGVEELFESQVWVNYSEIHKKNMLDAASKVVFQTTDEAYANRNKIQDMENLEITVVAEGKQIAQIPTTPTNLPLFDNLINEWEQHARQMGAATESVLGESPAAGTPFKLQELITAEAHSLHEYRKGKLATFLDEIYRDWIIPHIATEVTNGREFLAEFDLEELQQVADGVARCGLNQSIKDRALRGEMVTPEEQELFKTTVRESFMKGSNNRFVEILKGELRDASMNVKVNIVGKQKDLAGMTDKLVNVLRFMLSTYNPQTGQFGVFQDPRMAKLFNQIIESSGLSPIDFADYSPKPAPAPTEALPAEATKPLTQLAQRPSVAQTISST